EENSNISISTIDKGKKNIGGHSYSPVWEYFTRGEKVAKGKYKATCNLCGTSWNHGELAELEKKLNQYVSIIELDQQKIKKIHLVWAKAIAICGISWNIIENPFFIEALKETNLSYNPPTHQYLSGYLLEQQLAIINQKTNKIF
ncbi:23546_t:CDS:2, partial [Cetraspora pellucida]